MDSADLKAWYNTYTNADGSTLDHTSDVVQAVLSDELDHASIESRVQRYILTTKVDEAERLCEKCLHLTRHWPNLPSHIHWSEVVACSLDTEEIEAGSRCGCRFCHYLFFHIQRATPKNVYRKIEARLRNLEIPQAASLSVQNWAAPQPAGSQLLWVNLPGKRTTDCNSPMANIAKFMSNVMLPSSSSLWRNRHQADLDLARAWLQKCCDTHNICSKSNAEDRQRPTRLISLKDDTVKLVLTAEWEVMPPYATLSYCWGIEEFVMLKSGNHADFLVRIPYQEIPRTLQDAILVTRELGLEYIWIDALCIIQDSPGNVDWSHESSLMWSVYSRSHINIAASSAKGVFDGMFTKSTQYCGGLSARVTAINDGEVIGYSCVRSFLHHHIREESSDLTHLATRAWALQEKLLPPRTLSIGDSGLFWECREAVWSEYLPDGILPFIALPQVRAEDKEWDWSRVVSRYSEAKLTYGSDKLPALAGIAARQGQITKDKYLAGMWRKDLHLQLPWRVVTSTRKPRPEWRAPSWSWMSIDGSVSYPHKESGAFHPKRHVFVHILDASTSPTEPKGYGTVSDGQISLLCAGLVDGDVEYGNGIGPDTFVVKTSQKKLHIHMDCSPTKIVATRAFLLPTIRDRTGSSSGMDIKELENTDLSIHAARPGDGGYDSDMDDMVWFDDLHVSGLVLEQSADEPGHFCRAGSFELLHETCPNTKWFKTEHNEQYIHLLSAFDEGGATTAETVCPKVKPSDERPQMQYKLTIS